MSKKATTAPAAKWGADLRARIDKMPEGPAKIAEQDKLKLVIAEGRKAKLRELAAKRVPVAVRRIELVGNLAAYRPTETEAAKIISVLADALFKAKGRLNNSKDAPGQLTFDLDRPA